MEISEIKIVFSTSSRSCYKKFHTPPLRHESDETCRIPSKMTGFGSSPRRFAARLAAEARRLACGSAHATKKNSRNFMIVGFFQLKPAGFTDYSTHSFVATIEWLTANTEMLGASFFPEQDDSAPAKGVYLSGSASSRATLSLTGFGTRPGLDNI